MGLREARPCCRQLCGEEPDNGNHSRQGAAVPGKQSMNTDNNRVRSEAGRCSARLSTATLKSEMKIKRAMIHMCPHTKVERLVLEYSLKFNSGSAAHCLCHDLKQETDYLPLSTWSLCWEP